VSQKCHGSVTKVSQKCHGSVTEVSQKCHKSVAKVSRRCHGGVSISPYHPRNRGGVWGRDSVWEVSRLLEIIGLFRKRALQIRRYSAKETCNFEECVGGRAIQRVVYEIVIILKQMCVCGRGVVPWEVGRLNVLSRAVYIYI